jgi:hypothetical protein
MDSQSITELRQHIVGDVVVPDSPTYDALRNVFHQTGSPAVIVRSHTHEDIVTALRFAREQHLDVSVRSGGHSFSGLGTNTGGLVLDLTPFNTVEVLDPARQLVRIGAGARWGEVATELAAHGLAISSGDTRQVGVGGLTLGGGIGWMVRKYGLTIDSLHAAQLITADGQVLRVSADEHPDLFWAIRGGGGNFGVVTTFEFVAHPCTAIVGGEITYDLDDRETVLPRWARYMREAPEELSSTLVLFPGFGPQVPPQLRVLVCYASDDEAAASRAIDPLLHLGTVRTQAVHQKPYAAMLEDAVHPPPSMRMPSHAAFLNTPDDVALGILTTHYGRVGTPIVQIRSLGGAVARVNSQATAFAHREREAVVIALMMVPETATAEQVQHVKQAAWGPLAPVTNGLYLNFTSDVSAANVAAAYPGATYARLADIKATYDPENVFRYTPDIPPEPTRPA